MFQRCCRESQVDSSLHLLPHLIPNFTTASGLAAGVSERDHLVSPVNIRPNKNRSRLGQVAGEGPGKGGPCARVGKGLPPPLVPGPTHPLEDQPLLLLRQVSSHPWYLTGWRSTFCTSISSWEASLPFSVRSSEAQTGVGTHSESQDSSVLVTFLPPPSPVNLTSVKP